MFSSQITATKKEEPPLFQTRRETVKAPDRYNLRSNLLFKP